MEREDARVGSDIARQARPAAIRRYVWAIRNEHRAKQWIAALRKRPESNAPAICRATAPTTHWELRRRFTALPDSSRYASKDWRGRLSRNNNNHGEKLGDQFRLSREGRLRNGGYEFAQININSAGVDDLLTRGSGSVKKPANFNAFYEFERPRKGDWAHDVEAELFSGGLAGNSRLAGLRYDATYFISDAFNVHAGFYADRSPDWLVWQRDNLIGSFQRRELDINAGLDWTIDSRQELRVKLQAIALDADRRQAYRVGALGQAVASDDPVDDFNVRTLGFQIRYRYEVAPLSYLYVVYGRGGYEQAAFSDTTGHLLRESFSLRDDEQLLVKFSYRFEL